LSGINITNIGNPFSSESFNLNQFFWLPYLFTIIWILWIANLLSWSNGVDGQYGGIVGVAGIVIAVLALRFINISDRELDTAKMALICSGAAIGLIPFTLHPSKIMWGFGATSAGVALAALSILSVSKISISILVLLVPFMDGLITIIRRIVNKQNPFKGDRGHLHHLLLNRGWSVSQIALFYWTTTAILGLIAIYSSEKDLPLLVLTLGGVISFGIIILNLKLDKRN
jgi:UDP-GlcNAc:undecaprenyl-phosphate GlcNAc-1-phosphate transferase